MPLKTGKSKAAFSANVATEKRAGKSTAQAVAIAYHQSGEDCELDADDGFNEADHPRDKNGKFGHGGGGGSSTPDLSHLHALELNLSNTRNRAHQAKAKNQKEGYAVVIKQLEKEIEHEKKFLGISGATGGKEDDLSDEDLLAALGSADCDLEEDEDIDLESDTPEHAHDRRMAFDRSLRTETVDGRLVVESCNISKANVCPYFGREIPGSEGLGLEPGRAYMLYRDKAELEAARASYERIPLMMHHVASTASQPNKPYIVGTVSNVRYRHPFLIADLTVWDAEAIAVIESGAQRELSCGYRYVVDMTPGTTPEGEPYEGRMTRLVGNHVALVEAGRVGPEAFVHDSAVAS